MNKSEKVINNLFLKATMEPEKQLKLLTLSVIVIVILMIGSGFLLYNKITTDYTNKLASLENKVNTKVDTVENSLTTRIDNEKAQTTKQISALENKTSSNFMKLQDFFSTETSKLKLDIETVKTEAESGLEDISQKVGGLEEKSQELEYKLSEIEVTSSDFSAIVEDVVKAVVSIKTNKGQGSGVIFNQQGYIITNKHVIEGVQSIYVVDYNSNNYNVILKGTASNVDLAILKIDSDKTFNYLNFADSSSVKVGERVIAVGNPLGLAFSVTEGIISGVNRVIDSTGIPYIQTDVPINPGNSGGPLVNAQKKIVGINTLKIVDTEGIGFAIPADIAKSIAERAVD